MHQRMLAANASLESPYCLAVCISGHLILQFCCDCSRLFLVFLSVPLVLLPPYCLSVCPSFLSLPYPIPVHLFDVLVCSVLSLLLVL